MAPELNPCLVAKQDSAPVDEYAADMWSLGEITFQILTNESSFPDPSVLLDYTKNEQPFPTASLDSHKVSRVGQDYIISMMSASPRKRLTAGHALKHEWIEQHSPQRLRPLPPLHDELVDSVKYLTTMLIGF